MLDEELDLLASYGKDPNNARAKSLWDAIQSTANAGSPPAEDSENSPIAGGLSALGGADFTQQMLDLQRQSQSVQERTQQALRDQIARGEKMLRERRLGPSRSEQLLQLSAAFLQPRRYRGFGATMSNVLPVLAQQYGMKRENENSREDAIYKLQQQGLAAELSGESNAIENRRELLKILMQANKPQWARTENPATGEITITPVFPGGQGPQSQNLPRPQTEADIARYPSGTRFIAPDGTIKRKP